MKTINLEQNIAQMQELSKSLCKDVKDIREGRLGLKMARGINDHSRTAILANVNAVIMMQMEGSTTPE